MLYAKKWLFRCACLLSVSVLLTHTAMAQEENPNDTVLGTVIVTETGKKAKILDTNASITVLTEKDIKNSGQTSTASLITSIPGVVNQKTSSKTYMSVRGTRPGSAGGPAIYVDGIPLNGGMYDYSKIDTIPIDTVGKIEILKSPSPAIYGINASRGVILITTKRAKKQDKTFGAKISGEYGSWNTVKGSASVSLSLGNFDFRLNGSGFKSDGYRHTDDKMKTADGSLKYSFNGGSVEYTCGISDTYAKYAPGLPDSVAKSDPRTNHYYNGTYEVIPNDTDSLVIRNGLNFNYDKNNWLLNSYLNYIREDEKYKYLKSKNNALSGVYYYDRKDQQYSYKLNGGRRITLGETAVDTVTIGGDIRYQDFEQEKYYPYTTTTGADGDLTAYRKMLGFNVNNDLAINIFRLETGLRSNYAKLHAERKDGTKSCSKEYKNDMEWNISPSVSIIENSNLFVNYSHSKVYPNLYFLDTNMEKDTSPATVDDLKAETSDSVELGFKHQVSRAFNYSIVGYRTKIKDKMLYYYDSSNSWKGFFNAGTSIHQGIELEIDGRIMNFIGYRIGFSTIDAEWDEFVYKGTDYSGKKLNYVPTYEYRAGIDIHPFENTSYGSMIIAVDIHGFSKQYEDYDNTMKMDPAYFVDTKITYSYKAVEAFISCTNLFNKKWIRYYNNTGTDHSLSTFVDAYPSDGRYIGIGASLKI